MSVDPIETAEAVPRGAIVDRDGSISRVFRNFLEGSRRQIGKVVSGIATLDQAIQEVKTLAENTDGTLAGSYTVKIDLNGRVTAVRLYDDGSETGFEIDADKIFFGDQTAFDTTTETLRTSLGSLRAVLGLAPFGTSSNLLRWIGAASVPDGDETTANGVYTEDTSGVVRISGDPLAWGATASEAAASNAFVPYGANAAVNSEFNKALYGWTLGGNYSALPVSGGLDFLGTAGHRYIARSLTGTASPSDAFDIIATGNYLAGGGLPTSKLFGMRVNPGDRIYAGGLIQTFNATVSCVVIFLDSAGNYISNPILATGSQAGSYNNLSQYALIGGFATAPANARYVDVYFRGYGTGAANPTGVVARPILARVPTSQTAIPIYTPGPPDPLGDETESNEAASIADQGLFATGNYYEQSSDPGSVPNGSFWFQTTTNNLYVRRSGSWGLVGKITQGGLGRNDFSNLTTSGTTWVTLGTFDMTVAASGFLDFRLSKLSVNSASTLSSGSTFNGNWRITEATQAAPSTKTVVYSGTFSVEVLPPASLIWNTQPNDVVANTKSGACRYTFEVQRASGSNDIATGGLTGSLTGSWTPAAS